MSRKLRDPVTPAIDDVNAEKARRRHAECITELQGLPLARANIIRDVELEDGVVTPVSHGLGRLPIFVTPSAPRGATTTGRIDEVRSSSNDRSQTVQLKASGFGATITIDLVAL